MPALLLCFILSLEFISSGTSQHDTGRISGILTDTGHKDNLLPNYLQKLFTDNQLKLQKKWSKEFRKLCKKYDLNETDNSNIRQYVSVRLLHEMLTAFSGKNGSMGPILKIPFYTLWGDYNPRNEIYMVENNLSIASLPPPKDSGKYLSLSNIERTPVYFIEDLFNEREKYTNKRDTFASFGDSREREMAFIALANLCGFDASVAADESAIWSFVRVHFVRQNGEKIQLIYRVSNTISSSEWLSDPDEKLDKDRLHEVASDLNGVAVKEKTKLTLSQMKVSEKASTRIQKALDIYLSK
jgi:hypothetical protein